MVSATHSGHCQCCGRMQKLPGGVLAKHGYTVGFGFFQGVCIGTDHPPYEQSCQLIQQFVAKAQIDLSNVRTMQETWQCPATEPKGWFHEYRPATWKRRHSGYVWVYTDILVDVVMVRDYAIPNFYYLKTDPDTKTQTKEWLRKYCFSFPSNASVLDVCTVLNRRYADSMDQDIRHLESYIRWQERRVQEWKVMPLYPVSQKDDKAGFKPIG